MRLKKNISLTSKYSSPMWYVSFVFISCSWQSKVQMKHVKLTGSLSDGASVHSVSELFWTEPNNLWPCFIIISLFFFFFFSVFISCTVLFHFASTVIIKWWLSSSVTFPCHRSCFEFCRWRLKSHAYLCSLFFWVCWLEGGWGRKGKGSVSRGVRPHSRCHTRNLCFRSLFFVFSLKI